jgi:3',5'-cyclic AMP phosphodiesterase CpdA
MDLTTVADDLAVVFDRGDPRRYEDLTPDTAYELDGHAFRTFPRPGELLTRFATVNDVHFGETECGVLDGFDLGPIFTSEPGDDPYPDTMNRGAVAEMAAIDPAAVVVKGDLTSKGTRAEYQQFLDLYGPAFGTRLVHVRGNHDAYYGEDFASDAPLVVDLPGVRLAVIDTSIPLETPGQVRAETLEWLGDVASSTDRPVLVFGHHHAWNPGSDERPEGYFGINPDDSERLAHLVAEHPRIRGYFAGHTHRNRVRRFSLTGPDVVWVEVACVKDYPGAWAEYRVFEGGILQVFHRISTPEALAWSEKTRAMYGGAYHDYAFGGLGDRCFMIPV